jgi:tyrosinase
MNVDLSVDTIPAGQSIYLTWSPRTATAKIVDGPGAGTVAVTLQNAGTGGQLVFSDPAAWSPQDTFALALPGDGTPVSFLVAGKFGSPSSAAGDAAMQAVDGAGTVLGQLAAMVRVRKDANTLSDAERDRFLSALGSLNNHGMGQFSDFRNMHDTFAYYEAHGNTGFGPWHRAYLLDLERTLQAIDPSVALVYWRFDQPAPQLFKAAFMGVPDDSGAVQFTPGHALESWMTDGVPGINRSPSFDTSIPVGAFNEARTLAIGANFQLFQRVELNPHNQVHGSFSGFLSDPTIAPRDPLFFLLHANVDRLWAKWQWHRKRFNPADPNAYTKPRPARIGHNLNDTMWPWNGITGDGDQPTATGNNRPPTAPGGAMPQSPSSPFPPPAPTCGNMLDFQGVADAAHLMDFDYDDVPFEP